MTDEMMSLRALIEKAPDADFLREMIGFAAQRRIEPAFVIAWSAWGRAPRGGVGADRR